MEMFAIRLSRQANLQRAVIRGFGKISIKGSSTNFISPYRSFCLSSRLCNAATANSSVKHQTGKKPMTINSDLPDPLAEKRKVRLQFVTFMALVTVSFFAIVNYEKLSSPIIGSTLHFLRRSEKVKQLLGNNVDFNSIFPWISGEFNQVKGKIDIKFKIRGENGKVAIVTLVADRPNKSVPLTIHEWSVTVDDVKYDIMTEGSEDFFASS